MNRSANAYLPPDTMSEVAAGRIDAAAVRAGLDAAGITLSEDDFAGLLTETIENASTLAAQDDSAVDLDKVDVARLHLTTLTDGVDLGGLYELAEQLAEQGVR